MCNVQLALVAVATATEVHAQNTDAPVAGVRSAYAGTQTTAHDDVAAAGRSCAERQPWDS
ncbi:hypothetical protein MBOT_34720 [Mycobacterium botniense]|uniref:Uncharacterized protein n=1 Tax=Mycobacterium botniense TaxID=84962 RepID=A0A7I9Y2A4_9MYCO|nr:hypothetical protein MBOT_34720 [Mycobacterium botniense]